MKINFSRVMIAGTGSGCGKTTVTCAILKALKNRGLNVTSFKCGPDYIDPMFHSEIIGTKSRNLDMFLCGEETTKYLFAENSKGSDISIVEGVMGFYDGLGIKNSKYSSNYISNETNTPVILVVGCKGMALSIAAIIKGYTDFYKNNIKGVIINGASEKMYPIYKEIIESNTGVKTIGFLPKIKEATIESRHLGLVTASEIDSLNHKIDLLGENGERYIDIDGLLEIANEDPLMEYENIEIEKRNPVTIGVAKDKAFCFYYEDSLQLLKKMGAEIVNFSPLEDEKLPEGINGVILGGGYPEVFAEKLSKNESMLHSIKTAITEGMPVYAECGGFMYLGNSIKDESEAEYQMVGAIDMKSELTKRLQNFGYTKLISKKDNLLAEKGWSINAHEFHYSKSSDDGGSFSAVKPSTGAERCCIHGSEAIFAGYPHLHLWANVDFAQRYLGKCREYGLKK